MARPSLKDKSRQKSADTLDQPALNDSHTSIQPDPPTVAKRAKRASRKVKELEARKNGAMESANAKAQYRAEMRYQNEVHDPSRDEIREHNSQAILRENEPGSYEAYVPSFQRITNRRALQTAMIAGQIQSAQSTSSPIAPAIPAPFVPSYDHSPVHKSPATSNQSVTFNQQVLVPQFSLSDHAATPRLDDASLPQPGSQSGSDSSTDNESEDSEPGEFPAFDKRRIKAKAKRREGRRILKTRPRTLRQRKHDNNLNRGSLADIHLDHQPIVTQAIEIYTAVTLEEDPLGLEPAKPLARVAMRQASEEDGALLLKPNRFVIRLMSARNTNTRKPFVKLIRQLVPTYYGFSSQPGEQTVEANRLNCIELLRNGRFLSVNHTLPEIVGPYLCPLFFTVIKSCCFESKNAIGTRAAGRWTSVSLQFLAFLATAAQHCLLEWRTGECVNAPFTVKNNEGRYLGHLEKLKKLEVEGKMAMDIYRKTLVERAQKTPSTPEDDQATGVPDDIIKDWTTRYDVTSSNLVRDSSFVGGMAFGVQQPRQLDRRETQPSSWGLNSNILMPSHHSNRSANPTFTTTPPQAHTQTPSFDHTIQIEPEIQATSRASPWLLASENRIQTGLGQVVAQEAPLAQGQSSITSDGLSQAGQPTVLQPFGDSLPISASTGAGHNAVNANQIPRPSLSVDKAPQHTLLSSPVVPIPYNHSPSPILSPSQHNRPGLQAAASGTTRYQPSNMETGTGLVVARSLQSTSGASALPSLSARSPPLLPGYDPHWNSSSVNTPSSSSQPLVSIPQARPQISVIFSQNSDLVNK